MLMRFSPCRGPFMPEAACGYCVAPTPSSPPEIMNWLHASGFSRRLDRAGELRAFEIGAVEDGAYQIGVGEIGAAEHGRREVGAAQIDIAQDGAVEMANDALAFIH